MPSEEKLKQWAIIQFWVGLGHTPVQTMEKLNRSTKKSSVARLGGINDTVKEGKR